MRIYKLDARSESLDLEIDIMEPDLEESTQEGRLEGMSYVEKDILERYTWEKRDLARALEGIGMDKDSLLGSDTKAEVTVARALGGVGMDKDSLLGPNTEAEVTVVEDLKNVCDTSAYQPPPQYRAIRCSPALPR